MANPVQAAAAADHQQMEDAFIRFRPYLPPRQGPSGWRDHVEEAKENRLGAATLGQQSLLALLHTSANLACTAARSIVMQPQRAAVVDLRVSRALHAAFML